jgi:putative salt-induced outer membrane protein YdiY
MRWMRFAVVTVLLGSASAVLGDEVVLNNGDRLTGQVIDAAEGKVRIKTELAGEITVELKDVMSIATDAPVDLKLKDGSLGKLRLTPGQQPGAIQAQGPGEEPPQAIALEQIEAINPPPVEWTGSMILSGLVTQGNSETVSLSLSFDAVRRTEIDRVTVGAGYSFARQQDPVTDEDETTTDNWFLAGKYDYFMSEKLYLFGRLRVERDRIAELDLRVSPSAGVGYQWVERPDFNLNTEAGVAWVYEDYEDGDSEEHFAGRLAYHVDKELSDQVGVFHSLEYVPSVEDISDYNINADAGLRADITGSMFAEFRVEWRYDSTPAPAAAESDLRYVLGAGWRF